MKSKSGQQSGNEQVVDVVLAINKFIAAMQLANVRLQLGGCV